MNSRNFLERNKNYYGSKKIQRKNTFKPDTGVKSMLFFVVVPIYKIIF
jgi:hypothetical protein